MSSASTWAGPLRTARVTSSAARNRYPPHTPQHRPDNQVPPSSHASFVGASATAPAGSRSTRSHILAWDMLDSRDPKAAHASAHILTWSMRALAARNCDFAALRRARGPVVPRWAGALVCAPAWGRGCDG